MVQEIWPAETVQGTEEYAMQYRSLEEEIIDHSGSRIVLIKGVATPGGGPSIPFSKSTEFF